MQENQKTKEAMSIVSSLTVKGRKGKSYAWEILKNIATFCSDDYMSLLTFEVHVAFGISIGILATICDQSKN